MNKGEEKETISLVFHTQPPTVACKMEVQSEYVCVARTFLHVLAPTCMPSRCLVTKISAPELSRKFIKSALLAGLQVVSIFNLRDNEWRSGPELEGEDITVDAEAVQLGKTFLVVGGGVGDPGSDTNTDSLYVFDPEDYRWVRKAGTLGEEKRGSIPIAVPDNIVDCE